MRALFRLVRFLVAVAAAAVSLAVVAGIPPLLLALGGNPLPRRMPSLDDVTGLLTGVDTGGRVLLWALAACGWVAWAVLAGCLLLEFGARLAGRRAPRLPGLGGPQRLAGMLVAAALAGLTAVSPASAATTDPPVVAVAALEDTPTGPATGTPAMPTAPVVAPAPGTPDRSGPPPPPAEPAGPPATLVHEVARGDWMWHIAGRYLGDELRYPEIAALNPQYAVRYPGFPDHIEPGDRLVLPADAYDRGERPHATGNPHGSPPPPPAPPDREEPPSAPEPVDPGAVPSDRDQPPPVPEPADPEAVPPGPERMPPGPGQLQPDPEQVQPDPDRMQPDPERAPPVRERMDPGSVPPDPEPPDPAPVRWPYPGASPTAGPTPTPVPAGAAPPGTAAGVTGRGTGDPAGWPVAALATGVVASALVAGAVVRWRRRVAHRPHGVAPDGPAAATASAAGPGTDVGRLDRTLRHLSAAGVAADVAAVWVADGDIHLLLAAPSPPPAPFEADGTGNWVVRAATELPDPGDAAYPFPALATVGSRPGAQLLVDLEWFGAVTVAGEPDRCRDLLRHVVAELAHHPWSRPVRVTVAGFPPDQARLLASLDPDRVRVADSVGWAAAAHRQRLVEAAAAAPDTRSPWVLVASAGPESAAADRTALADLAAELSRAGRRRGVALVVAWGEGTDAVGGGGRAAAGVTGGGAGDGHGRLTIGPDGTLSAAFLDGGGTVYAPALPADVLGPYAALVRGGGAGDPAGGRRGTATTSDAS